MLRYMKYLILYHVKTIKILKMSTCVWMKKTSNIYDKKLSKIQNE